MTLFVAILVDFIILILVLRIYCRLTVGRCDSKQDMSGKTVLITGASAGIGKATALELARRNARVLLACRNVGKAEKVKSEIISATGNANIKVIHLDLCSFESVRKCATEVIKTEERLDVLINNAGTAESDIIITKDGCEYLMQVNYFGHFLLTLLLIDLLRKSKPCRIINVSSYLYLAGSVNLDDLHGLRYSTISRHLGILYCRSKLASILFTKELARRLEGSGITVNVLHPGIVKTDIFYIREHPTLHLFRFILNIVGKTAEEGAQTSVYLAVHPEVEKTSGKFFSDCREWVLFGEARNRDKARKLFDISEEIVGVTLPKEINTVQ